MSKKSQIKRAKPIPSASVTTSNNNALVVTAERPKAQWADDKICYTCQDLTRACTYALRDLDEEDQSVIDACEAAVVCATLCASHFSYSDEASLAERIGACNELATCCEALLAVIDDDDELKSVKLAAQACLEQCKETAGSEEEEEDGPAHPETDAQTVVGKADTKAQPRKDWLKVEARADGVHMVISGFIGADVLDESGTSETEFTNALKKISADQHIHLHVDSEGGSLPAGMAIYNALKARRPNVTTHIDGVALSCASLVALAGEPVFSPLASVWMIHSARIQTYGDDQEHKKSIKMLQSFTDMMADVYAEETGHDKDEILALMEKETWFTGAEAVEFGLADDNEQTDEPDESEEEHEEEVEREYEAPGARFAAVVAMYRPPEKIRELISTAKRGGITGTAASNSEKQNKSMKDNPTVAAASTAASNPFEARLMQERTARITSEVTRRAEGRIKNDQLKWWVDTAAGTLTSAEEQAVYAQIESMPVAKAAPGGNPLPADDGRTRAEFAQGDRIVAAHDLRWGADAPRPRTAFAENLRRLPHSQRVQVHRRDWTEHFGHCIKEDLKAGVDPKLPVAANTYSSTLITDFLVDVAISTLQNRWPALECVTRDFSTDRYKPLATGQVKLVSAGATTLVGTKSSPITSFESGDGTVRNIPVTLNHYSQPFHVGQDELMNGLRLENLTSINLAVLADTILANVLQSLATGGYNSAGSLVAFSAGTVNALAGTFSWNSNPGMPTLWARLKKSPMKNVILDGVFMANLINQPGFYQPTFEGARDSGRARTFGWDNIQENTGNWPSGLTNLGGFACNPQAIVAVAGLPQVPPSIPGATLMESVITIPGPDISIASYLWFSLASRTLWNSFDVVFGSQGGDATAGVLLFNQSGGI